MSGDRPENAENGNSVTGDAASEAAGVSPNLVQKLVTGLRVQLLASLVLAALLLLAGPVAAKSSFLGSLAVFLPGLMFTLLTVRKLGGDTAAFLRTATLAEFGKLLLMGALCAAVFVFVKPLAHGYFFLGMIVTMILGWSMLIRAFR